MFGNLQKKVRFGLDECRIYARANNIANDLNSINAGKGFSRLSYIKVLSWSVFIIVFAVVSAVIMPGSALGESGTISASVEIRSELVITNIAQLVFGQVRPGATDGTVVVTTANTRFRTGGTSIIGPKFSRAEYFVGGVPDAIYTITPGLAFSVHDVRGVPIADETSLEVTNLKSFSTTVGAETFTGKFNPNGVDTIFVGGTLVVPTTALNGKYSGSVVITVNY